MSSTTLPIQAATPCLAENIVEFKGFRLGMQAFQRKMISSNISKALVALTTLCASSLTYAIEWQVDTSETAKYYSNEDGRNQLYFEASTPPSGISIFRAKLSASIKDQGLDKACVKLHEYKGESGLFKKTVTTSLRFVNLSKIQKHIWNGVEFGTKDDSYRKYTVVLNDGTKIDAVAWRGDDIVSCGKNAEGTLLVAPLAWEIFSSRNKNNCDYDPTAVNFKTEAIAFFDKAFPFFYGKEEPGVGLKYGANFDAAGEISYGHDQVAIEKKFLSCHESLARLDADKQRETATRKTAQEDAVKIRKQQQELLMQERLKEAQSMRANVRVGALTNCGQIFSINLPMVGVQTMYGAQFIDINRLWGPSVSCRFENSVYVGP